jgi:uncharacterized delta-60 repeat protein
MDRQSAKEMFFGNPSEIIKDGKLTFKSSNQSGDLKQMSVSTGTPKQVGTTFTAGTVDFSFPNGDGYGFDKNVHDIKIQPDGKIIVIGDFDHYDYSGVTYTSPYICRLNADGTFDSSFDATGGSAGFNNAILTVHLQSDGKIVVGGDFTAYDRSGVVNTANHIARLNSDGSFDTTYDVGTGFDGSVYKIEVQSDGKIVIGGNFTTFNGFSYNRIIRLSVDGYIDNNFVVSDGFNNGDTGYVNDVIQQPDGKLLVGGLFNNYNGSSYNNIIRLNTNGSIDTTFDVSNGFNDEVTSIGLQSDGNIIVGGYFNTFNGNTLYNGRIVKISPLGLLHTRFGYGLDAGVTTLTIQSDDKILVGGFQTEFSDEIDLYNINKITRFHSNCTLDFSFYNENFLSNGVYSIAIQSDGKILIGGEFDTDGDPSVHFINHFGRINNKILEYPYVAKMIDCALSTGDFLDNFEDFVYTVGSKTPIDPNKIYSIVGTSYRSLLFCASYIPVYPSVDIDFIAVKEYDNCMLALEDNSKLVTVEPYLGDYPYDPTFLVDKRYKVGDYLFYSNLFVTAGEAVYFHGTFKVTGELPFNNSNTFDKIVSYVPYETGTESIEANGQYIVSQDCITNDYLLSLSYQEESLLKFVAQVDSDSPCKSNFFPCSFFSPYFGFIISYENLSAGTPTTYSTLYFNSREECLTNMSNGGIQRPQFNDGGFVNGFSEGPMVFITLEQPDGKILVAGDFYDYDGTTVNSLMRINTDGTIDNTFFQGGLDGYVKALALQPDGKILVGGQFNTYDGVNYSNIVRLNPDGTYDGTFNVGDGTNNDVRAIAVQHDGKIVIGGDFNNVDGNFSRRIARLNSNGSFDSTFETGNGFENRVFSIMIERTKAETEFYYTGGLPVYEEKIYVGGSFEEYDNEITGGVAILNTNGKLIPSFGIGFNNLDRVFKIERLSDGKLLIAGGFSEYNNTSVPFGLVRLNSDFSIDSTFNVPSSGGFNDWVVNFEVLPNGKILVGGQFDSYKDSVTTYNNTGTLVRLKSDGTYDTEFTFKITDNNVNTITYLQNKTVLVGGWFDTPGDKLVNLFIGGDYQLREFSTCDGNDSYIYLSTNDIDVSNVGSFSGVTEIPYEPISTSGLDLVYDGSYDDDNFVIVMPTPFDVNFLGTNYTEVNVSSNPYITFGAGGDPSACCFEIPNQIPSDVSLPGVFLSFECPNTPGDYDGEMYQLYSGLTDGGNTMIIKFIGSDHCDEIATLVYGFKFYKDNSDYFDLVIETNTYFFNGDPTGGVSNGVDSDWLYTFNSSSSKAYRIGGSTSTKTIKGDYNNTPLVCGNIGNLVTLPTPTGNGIPGSMYFDGNVGTMVQVDNSGGQFGFNGTNDFTIEWFQYYTGGFNARPFSIGVYSDPNEMIGMSFEGTVYLWVNNIAIDTNITNSDLLNGWHHIAITRNYDGVNHIWRVFLDGVLKLQTINNDDTTNTYTLTIGNQLNNDGRFEGYITNFRVNNLTALYTTDFTVPTVTLSCLTNIILLITSSDETNLITDTCGGQTVSEVGVTWSTQNPFAKTISFYSNSDTTEYTECTDCDSTVKYKATLYVREGGVSDRVQYSYMKKSDIDRMLTLGPIATTFGPESYELLKYYL